jgi:hypothetical protein
MKDEEGGEVDAESGTREHKLVQSQVFWEVS